MYGMTTRGRLSQGHYVWLSLLTFAEYVLYLSVLWFITTQVFHEPPEAVGEIISQLFTSPANDDDAQALINDLLTSNVTDASAEVNLLEKTLNQTAVPALKTDPSAKLARPNPLLQYLSQASLLSFDPRVSHGRVSHALSWLVSAYYLCKSGAQAVRRCHDLNYSGYWNVLLLVPYLSILWFLILSSCQGQDVENRFNQGTFKQNLQRALLKKQADSAREKP